MFRSKSSLKEIKYDTLHVECPLCCSNFKITVYSGPCENIDFSLDDAPLIMIAEVNHDSLEGEIVCVHCKEFLHIDVEYKVTVKSTRKSKIK